MSRWNESQKQHSFMGNKNVNPVAANCLQDQRIYINNNKHLSGENLARQEPRRSSGKCIRSRSSSSSSSNSSSSSSSDSGSSTSGSSSSSSNCSSNSSSSKNSGAVGPKIVQNPVNNDSAQQMETKTLDETYKIDEYFRNTLKDKLSIEFKAALPEVNSDLPDSNPKLLRVPNFLPVEPQMYEAHSFMDDLSTNDNLKDKEAREAYITKLRTTVRWRECQDKKTGEIFKESNARIVRWSDGSETFHVGAEAFDVVRHPVSDNQNQWFVRMGNYYQSQCTINDKLTLRPKLESSFGLSHVQGLRKRAFDKPTNSSVKVLMDLNTNPLLDRERKVKEGLAQVRKEKCEMRREQKNQLKPSVQPMRHCTADDADVEMVSQKNYHHSEDNSDSFNSNFSTESKRSLGIRTNRNTEKKPTRFLDSDSDDE